MNDLVLLEVDAGIATVTLNRPDKRNAMSDELRSALIEALETVNADAAIRAMVLTGAGKAFCAGGDVAGMERRMQAPAGEIGINGWRRQQRVHHAQALLHTMPKPTIAMVNGHAVGAGLSLALACDIRIASDRAKLGTVFRNVGFSGDFGGSYLLQKLVGIGKARELYFTGEILPADAALAIGMVNRVVEHDRLEAETMELATRLASGPTLAYARMKENLNRGETCDLLTALDQEAINMSLSSTTSDHQEAARAFVEKRQPSFKGG